LVSLPEGFKSWRKRLRFDTQHDGRTDRQTGTTSWHKPHRAAYIAAEYLSTADS